MQETLGNLKETVESIREARKYRLPEDLEIEFYEKEKNMLSTAEDCPRDKYLFVQRYFPKKKNRSREKMRLLSAYLPICASEIWPISLDRENIEIEIMMSSEYKGIVPTCRPSP